MAFSAILFDLDGTLLPMDQELFVKLYFRQLTRKLAPYGFAPQQVIDGIQGGIAAMVRNDGQQTNEAVFWDTFNRLMGGRAREIKPMLADFYRNEFQQAQQSCSCNPQSRKLLDRLQQEGRRIILATNPIFPAIATESRIRWAGLELSDFELYTTYETAHFCKPNPAYYREILQRQGLRPEDCLMIGNDATEDTAAQQLGIQVFLLTDCLINRNGYDISRWPNGSFQQLHAFLDAHQ